MPPTQTRSRSVLLPLCLAGGFLARLIPARLTFLNPDEVLHYLLSHQPSLAATYEATLTTAHPPLLILFLHYWQLLGHSEIVLRFPSLLAGTAFAWVMYLWLKRVLDRSVALTGLVLFLFSPAIVSVSAEVRQYAFLLFFAATSLYFLERAIGDDSAAMMLVSAIALYLALLTHYSSLIFALTLGVYALVRLRGSKANGRLIAAWGIGQAGALAICGFLYYSHIAQLSHSALPKQIADTWLRASIFHPGDGHVVVFVASRTVRLFRYLFSNGTIGFLALLVFLCGLLLLMLDHNSQSVDRRPTPRQVALLLSLPFLITAGVAVAGIYPYGGTRHDVLLSIFAMSGIAVGLGRLKVLQEWQRLAAVGAALAIGNLFPFPTPPFIKPMNQNRVLMSAAMASMRREAPPGSVFLTDYEGGLMLSYYLCPDRVVEIKTTQTFLHSACGNYRVIASSPELWSYDAQTLPEALREVSQESQAGSGANAWLFQAGWIDEKQAEWIAELSRSGCGNPQLFGPRHSLVPNRKLLAAARKVVTTLATDWRI